jgi:uncharacterized protein (DUF1697 family)/GNAT superfamily N-acetyltransferase
VGFWDNTCRPDVLERVSALSETIALGHHEDDIMDGFVFGLDVGFRTYLSELAVTPASQGRAVGSHLVFALERRLPDRGCSILIPALWRDAEPFYRSPGRTPRPPRYEPNVEEPQSARRGPFARSETFPSMTIHIGLLRAVNLPGHNKIGMADLCELLVGLGMHDVRSLLQSGNVVFRSDIHTTPQLEPVLEHAVAKRFGLATDFFVRTTSDWKGIIAGNPFPEEAERDPGHLLVIFLKEAPTPQDVTALQNAIKGREVVRVKGRHAYVVYPDGVGRSRLTNALIEKKLATRGTGRNWNTVLKLGVLATA